jgi:tetratricopeptide (TPR) repeat protein
VYRRQQDPDKAIPEYEKAVALAPDMSDAWYDLGYMYKLNHDNDKAINAFNTYLELTHGKDEKNDKQVTDEIESMGGKPATPAPDKDKPKGKSKGKGKSK